MASPTSVLIEGERLALRELVPEDAPALREAVDDPVAGHFYVSADPAFNDMDAYIAGAMANAAEVPRMIYQLAVVLRDGGTLIGRGYVTRVGGLGVPELGMVVSSRYRGQSFGTEATRLFLQMSFDRLGLEAVWAICRVENIATQRVCERVGMRLVRRITDRVQTNGERGDSLLYVAERHLFATGPGTTPIAVGEPIPTPRFAACRCLRPACPCPWARHYGLELRAGLRALGKAR